VNFLKEKQGVDNASLNKETHCNTINGMRDLDR
jgi:hypothetical protein